jgi:hypothetical protein
MTLTELITYTDVQNTTCNGLPKHNKEEAVVTAYIQKLNTFPSQYRFQIFEGPDIINNRMDVYVSTDFTEVFDKISKGLSKSNLNDFVPIKVRGTITSKPLPMNGKCKMSVFLTISSPDYIKF